MPTNEQIIEITRCIHDFKYFAQTYLKCNHHARGIINLEVEPFHERLIRAYEANRFVLLTKFRSGRYTTMTQAFCLWRAMFHLDQRIMTTSKTDREAIACGDIVHRFIDELPDWLKPKLGKYNDHHIEIMDTDSYLHFATPEAARGRTLSLLVIDEAAFITKMEEYWKAVYPCVSAGGKVIVYSTPNGWKYDGWFETTHQNALDGKNSFYVYEADYTECSVYRDPLFVEEMENNLGIMGFKMEVLQEYPYKGRLRKQRWVNPTIT